MDREPRKEGSAEKAPGSSLDPDGNVEVTAERPEPVTAEVGTPTSAPSHAGPRLATGTLVGRYIIVQPIGAGAMGAVALAYDTKLERKVAIKTLLVASGPEQARMLREAQTMARLSHPNVAAIYDVGVHEGSVFLAMEFIDGVTLREWLKTKRPQREILNALKKAGRGLAAAHRAGIVHRDFKPSNVLVAANGRVCVVDFGIARADDDAEPEAGASLDGVVSDPGSPRSTYKGVRAVGTLGYLAPEQIGAQAIDARADVFSFCVTAWKSLYGVAPFPTDSLEKYADAIYTGTPTRPRDAQVPRWQEDLLRRGLRVDPKQRFASMEELLLALDADPRRRRTTFALVAIVVAAAALVLFVRARHRVAIRRGCEEEGSAVPRAWKEKQGAVLASIRGAPDPLAGARADHAAELLDRYAEEWKSAQGGSCLVTRLEERQTEAVHSMRTDCLLRGRQQLDTALSLLAGAEPAVSRQVLELLHKLPSPRLCDAHNAEATHAELPKDPAAQAAARSARAALARASVEQYVGHVQRALDEGHRAEDEARGAGDVATEARAALLCGSIDTGIREDDEHGIPELARAIALAETLGDEATACIGAARIATSVANRAHRVDLARPWVELARAKLGRLGANAEAEYALLLADGSVAGQEGDLKKAEEVRRRSVEVTRVLYGEDSLRYCYQIANLGLAFVNEGDLRAAEPSMREAVRCAERGDGRFGVSARLHWYLADTLVRIGTFDLGAKEAESATTIQEGEDPDSPPLSEMYANLARAWDGAGRFAEAERAATRGIAIAERLHSTSGSAEALFALGEARAGLGDVRGAREACALSETLHEQDNGLDAGKLYDPDALRCQGEAELELGQLSAAREHLARSLTLPKRAVPGSLAWTRFAMARGMARAGTTDKREGGVVADGTQARQLAEAAKSELASQVGSYPSLRPKLEAVIRWIAGL